MSCRVDISYVGQPVIAWERMLSDYRQRIEEEMNEREKSIKPEFQKSLSKMRLFLWDELEKKNISRNKKPR